LSITLRSGTCDGTVVYTEPVPSGGAFTATTGGAAYTTTNDTFSVATATAGTYYWKTIFTPTSSFAAGYTDCELSTVAINDNP